ncbi:uncharacterized protein LOC108740116 [Agrilus planipennis]|uniref:Uncharacterized protein LOC108740116 n=1 Tax=Agrilus planipennis TaxID=224129 RepID=A0A1W4XAH3_AGRPL|nr:uncharacterized protein LOC108740116 [Agrilus planipennis]
MPFKYIGRTTDFKGKTLWEIVGNLKNYGIGRYIKRNVFERYPEPSFMKIVKVETLPSPLEASMDDLRKVKVWVEKTFRGRKFPDVVPLKSATYKSDYVLIPKDEEKKYSDLKLEPIPEKILPRTTNFPPLLKELIYRDAEVKGETLKEEPKLKIIYKESMQSCYRVAKEGETPNVQIAYGLGTPISPSLYQGIKLK